MEGMEGPEHRAPEAKLREHCVLEDSTTHVVYCAVVSVSKGPQKRWVSLGPGGSLVRCKDSIVSP